MTREEIERLIAEGQRQVGEALRARLSENADRPLTIDESEALVEEVGREEDTRLEQRLIEEHQQPTGNAPNGGCGAGDPRVPPFNGSTTAHALSLPTM